MTEKIIYLNDDFFVPENYTGTVKFADGRKQWYLNGILHRVDGPAVDRADGNKYWYLNGKYHREDGPAVEGVNGYKSWWLNGEHHRVDGPAIEYSNGLKEWWFENHKVCDNVAWLDVEGNYIVIERGIPTDIMFGDLKLTFAKLLTAEGTVFLFDNLPGLDIGEENE